MVFKVAALVVNAGDSDRKVSKKTPKYPPRPIKRQLDFSSLCDESIKRYPIILAELAK